MENKNISPAVSIIIPMYNVEKYIAELLDSILAQTFKNFEVILVDNGSTDKSHAIAESYIPKFAENIQGGGLGYKIITLEENSGNAAKPRNVGIKIARGEYVWLVDSDDVISPTALEELYPIAKENDVDVLQFPIHYEFHGETLKDSKLKLVGKEFKPKFMEKPIVRFSKGFTGAPWKYLLSRELIVKNNVEFPDIIQAEDRLFFAFVAFFARNFFVVPNIVYYWRKHPSSVTANVGTNVEFFRRRVNMSLNSAKYIEEFTKRFDFFRENAEVKFGIFSQFVVMPMERWINTFANEKLSMKDRENIFCEFWEVIKNNKSLMAFLFNKMVDLKADNLKKDAELNKLNEQMQPLKEDNKKFQTENQELKLKVQSTSEITSKMLEKIEDKAQLAPFLFNQAIDLKEESLKKDIELKKLREENKKLLEENKKIQEQLAATSKKLQDEIKKLQSAAS